jgi:hypothetical protein
MNIDPYKEVFTFERFWGTLMAIQGRQSPFLSVLSERFNTKVGDCPCQLAF